jgi:Histidine kinase-, DNA gyrase B-, and HSP90-like ATPase./PAS fold.
LEAVGSTFVAFGKTPYDLFPHEIADTMVKFNNLVMQSGKILSQEEHFGDFTTGQTKYFTEFKAPLYDNNGKIIGILGTAVDITSEKEAERLKLETEQQRIKLKEQENFKKLVDQAADDIQSPLAILLILVQQCTGLTKNEVFKTIERFADVVPVNLYWLDENHILLGANKRVSEDVPGDYTGKTPYDYFPFEIADKLVQHNKTVMQSGKVLSYEEQIKDMATGITRCVTAFKAPLYDNTGKVIGILGTSVDITTQKEAESLKLETELQKVKLQEQERFRTIANQVAHDIRSPLASLQMIVKVSCKNLVEKERIALNSVAKSITDVANNLLSGYRKANAEAITETIESEPILVSLALSKVVSEKRHQYTNSPVRINDFCELNSIFVFVKTDLSNFSRMISNLVNNAVDAFEGKEGKVDLKLSIENDHVKLTIQDNGKGMPQEVIDKVMSNVAVTSGKKMVMVLVLLRFEAHYN